MVDEKFEKEDLGLNVINCLKKPIDMNYLLEKINSILMK